MLEVIIEEATNVNRDSQVGKDDELTDGFMKGMPRAGVAGNLGGTDYACPHR